MPTGILIPELSISHLTPLSLAPRASSFLHPSTQLSWKHLDRIFYFHTCIINVRIVVSNISTEEFHYQYGSVG